MTRIGAIVAALLVVVALPACGMERDPADALGGRAVTVEVAALEHPPVQAVLTDIEQILTGYGDRVSIRRYDLETPEGELFAERHDLVGHTPLALFVDGSMNVVVNGRNVTFLGFPQGGGPLAAAEGSWTLDDLDAAIAERTGAAS
ncbi:MAG: hypothetical protein ACRD0K_14705 [Egibacteraceae bacterium]